MVGFAAIALSLAALSQTDALELEVFSESIRVDLSDGRLLESPRLQERGPVRRPAARLRLRGVRDEVLAFQIAVRGGPGTYSVEWTTPFASVEGRVFAELPIVVEEPSRSATIHSLGPGHYPDVLVPTSTAVVPAGPAVAVLWVDLWIPPDSRPGVQVSTLRVGGGSLAVEVDVLDLSMPSRDVARLSAVNFGSFLEKEKLAASHLLRWMQLAHAHHLSVEFLRPVPAVAATGEIGWDDWGDRLGPYFDGTAFQPESGYRGPRAGLPVTRFVLPHTDRWPSAADGRGLPTDGARWSSALAEWEVFARSRGWFDAREPTEFVLFVNSLDEPKTSEAFESLGRYASLIEAARLSDPSRVRFRVDGPLGQPAPGWSNDRVLDALGPVVDDWNVCGAVAYSPWALLRDRLETHPDERAFFYASNTSGEPATPPLVVDAPVAGARAWAWIVFRYGLGGALNWEVDFRPGCVLNPACSGDPLNLDATLMYRGHEVGRGFEEPIASVRLKALRRGAQDVALLALLAERDPEEAAAIAELLIPRALGHWQRQTGFGRWPVDPGPYERAREAILDRLSGQARPMPLSDIRPNRDRVFLGLVLVVATGGLAILLRMRARRRVRGNA